MGTPYLQELQALAASEPGRSVQVIVRLREAPSGRLEGELTARGLRVRRSLHLVPAVAVEGAAEAVALLASEPWVLAVEEDREVTASEDD